MERIARATGAPIVPVYMDGLWGSAFSRSGRGPLLRWRGGWGRKIRVRFGRTLSSDTPAADVRRAVEELWQAPVPRPA